MRYEVRHYSICDGWVNSWTENGQPMTFATHEEAQAEIDEFLSDIQTEINLGLREEDEGYDESEFIVAEVGSPTPIFINLN